MWKAYLGKDFVNVVPSNTLVAGDKLIVAYGIYLLGLSTDTGELRWEQTLPQVPVGDLLLLDNQVIATFNTGQVIAYNPVDGKTAWKQQLPGGVSNIPTYTDKYFLFTTRSNSIDLIERKTGTRLGTTDTQDRIDAAPLLLGRALFLAYAEGGVKLIDDDLVARWSFTIPDSIITDTPVTDGKASVFVNCANMLVALHPGDNSYPERWVYHATDNLDYPVTLSDSRIYIALHSKRLLSLDAKTGKDLWFTTEKTTTTEGKSVPEKKAGLPKAGLPLYAAPVGAPLVLGDSLLVRMESGLMGVYDKGTGALQWLYRLKPPAGLSVPTTAYMGAPAIVGNDLYFAGMDGTIYHLSASAPDLDPPTFDPVYPPSLIADQGLITPDKLLYAGALVLDEGCGVLPTQMSLSLDGVDMTKSAVYDAPSGYFYYKFPTTTPLTDATAAPLTDTTTAPLHGGTAAKTADTEIASIHEGMHRLVITAKDTRGNIGTLKKDFIVATKDSKERVVINISGEFVPQHLVAEPGTVISWRNSAGSPRSVIADLKDFSVDEQMSSDGVYPDGIPEGAQWVWIVPKDVDTGTMIYYHCRLKGQAGDGNHPGTGLVGVIEIGTPVAQPATAKPAVTPP